MNMFKSDHFIPQMSAMASSGSLAAAAAGSCGGGGGGAGLLDRTLLRSLRDEREGAGATGLGAADRLGGDGLVGDIDAGATAATPATLRTRFRGAMAAALAGDTATASGTSRRRASASLSSSS